MAYIYHLYITIYIYIIFYKGSWCFIHFLQKINLFSSLANVQGLQCLAFWSSEHISRWWTFAYGGVGGASGRLWEMWGGCLALWMVWSWSCLMCFLFSTCFWIFWRFVVQKMNNISKVVAYQRTCSHDVNHHHHHHHHNNFIPQTNLDLHVLQPIIQLTTWLFV